MRLCTMCGKPDTPYWEAYPCTCGAPAHDDDPSPLKHRPDCKAIGHSVISFPVRIPERELGHDAAGNKQLPQKYAREGWKVQQRGFKWYRVKVMCRDCVAEYEQRMARKRDYEASCKRARGEETQTYAQFLASQ